MQYFALRIMPVPVVGKILVQLESGGKNAFATGTDNLGTTRCGPITSVKPIDVRFLYNRMNAGLVKSLAD